MQGLVVERQGRKVRINSRTWVVDRQEETVVEAQAVSFRGEKKRRSSGPAKGLLVADSAEILKLNLERQYGRVVRFARECGVYLSENDSPTQMDTLGLLLYMGRRAVVKKLLAGKKAKLFRYVSNPFLLYLNGHLDFHSARVISLRTLMPSATKDKVQAWLYHLVDEAYKNGRESIPVADAVFELSVMMDADEGEIEAAVMEIRRTQRGRKKLYINDRVYLAWVYYMKIKAMKAMQFNTPFIPHDTDDGNVRELLSHRYAILTGDPGTGKTTLLRKLAETCGGRCVLAGLTGKAAQVLGRDAATVHSLLGYGPRGFAKKQLDCDVLVIDEASMINWRTLHAVLAAAPRVVFAGDPKQLPPVEGENVFSVMMEVLPVVKLEKAWRYKNGLDVTTVRKDSDRKVFAALSNLLCGELRGKNAQVITPVHGGLLGTAYLNEYLQKLYNAERESLEGIKTGDKVIVNQNVYTGDGRLIAANGTVGTVSEVRRADGYAFCLVNTAARGAVLLERRHIDLAYALTVHKYQGSECDHIIFVIPDRKKIREDFITEEMLLVGKTRGRVRTYVLEVCDA